MFDLTTSIVEFIASSDSLAFVSSALFISSVLLFLKTSFVSVEFWKVNCSLPSKVILLPLGTSLSPKLLFGFTSFIINLSTCSFLVIVSPLYSNLAVLICLLYCLKNLIIFLSLFFSVKSAIAPLKATLFIWASVIFLALRSILFKWFLLKLPSKNAAYKFPSTPSNCDSNSLNVLLTISTNPSLAFILFFMWVNMSSKTGSFSISFIILSITSKAFLCWFNPIKTLLLLIVSWAKPITLFWAMLLENFTSAGLPVAALSSCTLLASTPSISKRFWTSLLCLASITASKTKPLTVFLATPSFLVPFNPLLIIKVSPSFMIILPCLSLAGILAGWFAKATICVSLGITFSYRLTFLSLSSFLIASGGSWRLSTAFSTSAFLRSVSI